MLKEDQQAKERFQLHATLCQRGMDIAKELKLSGNLPKIDREKHMLEHVNQKRPSEDTSGASTLMGCNLCMIQCMFYVVFTYILFLC